MAYRLLDVPLIPQSNNMACWYASAQMLISWRRARTRMTEIAHPDPSEVPSLEAKFAAHQGLPYSQTIELAKMIGLTPVPLMTPSPWAIEHLLLSRGPLWFAGKFPSGHAVVITGISDAGIEINDPWPPNVGRKRTLSLPQYGSAIQPLPSIDNSLEAIEQLLGIREAPLTPNLLYLTN